MNAPPWKTIPPTLVITYKNHSLDEFLTDCLGFTNKVVRIGGRSRCPEAAEVPPSVGALPNGVGFCSYTQNTIVKCLKIVKRKRVDITLVSLFGNLCCLSPSCCTARDPKIPTQMFKIGKDQSCWTQAESFCQICPKQPQFISSGNINFQNAHPRSK